MAPAKVAASWDDEESDSDSSSGPSSPPLIARRSKFEDEEDDDVLDSWDAAEDSEVEREKAKKAAEAKAKAEAEAKANHKTKKQRIEDKIEEKRRARLENELDDDDSEEDEATRRARLRATEKEADLRNAEDLFAGVGGVPESRTNAVKAVTVQAGDDPADAIDLTKLKVFQPAGIAGFKKMRETVTPLLVANAKKPQYESFMKEFVKDLSKELNSEQIKKIASGLTALSNEKLREEKAAEKGGKKTKAAKTKTSLAASRDISSRADTTFYDDGLDE
jgi:translation initiation factor 3 subunit J